MSNGLTRTSFKMACECKPRSVIVIDRKCNYSAFNGYRCTPSLYSKVQCTKCLAIWRTKAAYVDQAPDGELRYIKEGEQSKCNESS